MLTPVQDWVMGAAGGLMIGLAAVLLMGSLGRIAGISGLAGGLLDRLLGRGEREAAGWRFAFIAGVVLGPLLFAALRGGAPVPVRLDVTAWPLLAIGGLLVGFGTRLGAGCTSGHGVCGLARLSARSLVATAVFFIAALATVFATRQLGLLGLGG